MTSSPDPADRPGPATKPGRQPLATRLGGAWGGIIGATVVLVLLLIFILRNGNRVKIEILFWSVHMQLGVALLLAAALGVLLVAVPASMRIMQLRRRAKRAIVR